MKAIFALTCCLIACSALAEEKELIVPDCSMTSKQFLDTPPQGQAMFSAGFVGGLFLSPMMGAPDMAADQSRVQRVYGCVKGMSSAQIGATISKFVSGHPETMGNGVCTTAYRAIATSCNMAAN